jgi:hypothetical protein
MMQRQLFAFSDTGTEVQVGVPFFGEIHQLRWARAGGDSGGAIEVALLPDGEDTGLGFVILSCGLTPAGFLKSPVEPTHQPDGLDTGTMLEVPYVGAGDRLQVKRTATGPAGTGRLYAWVRVC